MRRKTIELRPGKSYRVRIMPEHHGFGDTETYRLEYMGIRKAEMPYVDPFDAAAFAAPRMVWMANGERKWIELVTNEPLLLDMNECGKTWDIITERSRVKIENVLFF